MGTYLGKKPLSKTHVLYISRTSMLEPLGQTQVLNYLEGLSKSVDFTLISFEKKESDDEKREKVEIFCEKNSIDWIQIEYRNRPRFLAGFVNFWAGIVNAVKVQRRRPITFVHSRSYIPAAIALFIKKFFGVPYVFDLRGLWPEELVTSHRVNRGSLAHRLIERSERYLLLNAAIVVSVTKAGTEWLCKKYGEVASLTRSYVIPGSADLDRFKVVEQQASAQLTIGCHGSILNGWFRPDLLGRAFSVLAQRLPLAKFEIVTTSDAEQVLKALGDTSSYSDRLRIYESSVQEMAEALSAHDLSVFFYASGMASELGRSPVRMGEALGCGLPVLTNSGVGDVAEIVHENEVGVIIADETDESMQAAVDQILPMIRDMKVKARCRFTAEKIFSLSVGTQSYQKLYEEMQDYKSIRNGQRIGL